MLKKEKPVTDLRRIEDLIQRSHKAQSSTYDLLERVDPIRLHVRPTWQYVAIETAPYIGGLFGSLLTVPGILAFKDASDRKRKERLRIEIAGGIPKDLGR
jgi:hypothetical protein